ncbi:MAG TPA: hypothetical protein VD931_17035, partial [Baekduia sp.]|nr:hypothetical protein [Baekduia sp.]
EAAALDALQGTMRVVAGTVDRRLLARLAAELPAALKPVWDPPDDADRFRTAQADEGTPLRAPR